MRTKAKVWIRRETQTRRVSSFNETDADKGECMDKKVNPTRERQAPLIEEMRMTGVVWIRR
jgi:hypothetical protein